MILNDRQYIRAVHASRCLTKYVQQLRLYLSQEGPSPSQRVLLKCHIQEYEIQRGLVLNLLAAYEAEHDSKRAGTWIQTYSGGRFWLLDPRANEVEIEDIAQGLSRTSRFFGATRGLGYTVAQHCVVGSYFTNRPLAFLLHDATEAYVGDVISPLKKLLGRVYSDIEDRIMRAVAERCSLDWGEEAHREVKRVDEIMLATEVRDLVPCQVIRYEPVAEPLAFEISEVWDQDTAKAVYLKRFEDLTRVQRTRRSA